METKETPELAQSCFWSHRWTKWHIVEYVARWGAGAGKAVLYQQRECVKCGRIETDEL